MSREQAAAIAGTLGKLFGTPDEPAVPEGVDLDMKLLKMAAGPIGSDADDRAWGLYRKHCVACHGLSGDGGGANAADLDPYPRDFGSGVFKYTSTAAGLNRSGMIYWRTLHCGIPGTAMPSFAKLPSEQIESLVEYVKYLQHRGETELYLMQIAVDEHAALPLDPEKVLSRGVEPATASWGRAAGMAIVPPPAPRADMREELSVSIERGREFFAPWGAVLLVPRLDRQRRRPATIFTTIAPIRKSCGHCVESRKKERISFTANAFAGRERKLSNVPNPSHLILPV